MAGKDDDIERLLREMDALSAQADAALGGDDASGKGVAKRRGSEPEKTAAPSGDEKAMSPGVVRALVVSGVATGLVTVLFVLLAVLPFFATPGLSDILAVFISSLLVAVVYTVMGRRRS